MTIPDLRRSMAGWKLRRLLYLESFIREGLKEKPKVYRFGIIQRGYRRTQDIFLENRDLLAKYENWKNKTWFDEWNTLNDEVMYEREKMHQYKNAFSKEALKASRNVSIIGELHDLIWAAFGKVTKREEDMRLLELQAKK